jgi:hypothetical protein
MPGQASCIKLVLIELSPDKTTRYGTSEMAVG